MIQEKSYYNKNAYDMIGQYDNWCNLLDMANAVRYGFSQYRLPKPGQSINIQEAQARITSIEDKWSGEYDRRGDENQKPCPEFKKCSLETQCYLHSILESAPDETPFVDDWGIFYGT